MCNLFAKSLKASFFSSLICFTFVFTSLLVCQTHAQDWSKLAVMDQGRVKSFDSYSRHLLIRFSGKSTVKSVQKDSTGTTSTQKIPSSQWFKNLIFHPRINDTLKVFRIDNPEIADAYGIERSINRLYSYTELKAKQFKIQQYYDEYQEIDSKDLDILGKDFVRIGGLFKTYEAFAESFNYLEPDAVFTIQDSTLKTLWGIPQKTKNLSFWQLTELQPQIGLYFHQLRSKSQDAWDTTDGNVMKLVEEQNKWGKTVYPEMFPVFQMKHQSEEFWLSPRELVLNRFFDKKEWSQAAMEFHSLRKAIRTNDKEAESKHLNRIVEIQRGGAQNVRFDAMEWEDRYNQWDLVYRSEIIFGIGLLLLLLTQFFRPSSKGQAQTKTQKVLTTLSMVSLGLGVFTLTSALGIRMYVSQRPPITNLYETFLFVAWSGSLLGLWVYIAKKAVQGAKDPLGLILGNFMGLSLCLLAAKNEPMGDTMGVLVAVLDSNFWLTTHVITITLGYAGVCAAGVLGYIYLFKLVLKVDKDSLESTYKSMIGVLGFGLTTSFVGTVLGGIWADQSWGRFWGWDPKENGALLIVLWVAILFHARLAGWLKKAGMAAGATFGISIVMLAWFGVNLLGVGLHSYGFTDGAATALIAFIALQFIVTTICMSIINKK